MEVNKIYCEDCLETMSKMKSNFIDLTITSPPYDNLRSYKGYSFKFEEVAKQLFRVTKDGGVIVWVVGDSTTKGSESGTSFKQALFFKEVGFNLHDTMIYEKINFKPLTHNRYEQSFEYMFILSKGRPTTFNPIKEPILYPRNRKMKFREVDGFKESFQISKKEKITRNIWRYKTGGGHVTKDKVAFEHPAIFPEQLVYDHIISWSNEGDLIYDPFAGSGTVPKMAILSNRNWIASEISSEYCQITERRIYNLNKV